MSMNTPLSRTKQCFRLCNNRFETFRKRFIRGGSTSLISINILSTWRPVVVRNVLVLISIASEIDGLYDNAILTIPGTLIKSF